MSRLRIASLLVVVALVAAACGGSSSDGGSGGSGGGGGEEADAGEPQQGGVLAVPVPVDPTTLDLMQESNLFTQQVATQMYDTLVRLDPEQLPDERELIPSLATEWTVNEEATEITLTLREGVTFHDGEPFTSEDVKATLERARDAPDGTVSIQGFLLEGVTVETPDDHTVVLASEDPKPTLLEGLSTPAFAIVPAHVVTEDPHGVEQEPVGTGPFMLQEWRRGTEIELVRNDSYWQEGLPYLDGIRFVLMPDLTTRTSAYVSGNIHISGQGVIIPATEWETLEQQVPGTQLWEHNTATVFQTWFNTQAEPFDDPNVRRAFALVADQDTMGERAFEGFFVRNSYGSAEGLEWALPTEELEEMPGFGEVTEEDKEEARRLLDEAGYGDGLEVDYLVGDIQQYIALAEVYAGMLEEIGVTANIRVQALDAEVTPALREGNYQMAQAQAGANFYDACLTLAPYSSSTIGSTNMSHYSNPDVDELYATLCSSPDRAERVEAAQEIQRILWEDVPAAVSPGAVYVQGARPEVHGVTHPGILRENLWYETVWLDQE